MIGATISDFTVGTTFPDYALFRKCCSSGLREIRPIGEAASSGEAWEWNFSSGWAPSYAAYGRMRALMALSEARELHPNSVLEVAAGDAALCASLASSCRRVVANDIRREHLERAVRTFTNGDRIEVLPGNLFDLDPAVTGVFDLVVACEIVEHVAHALDFLKQLTRFVAPGGRILLTTPNGSYCRNTLPTHSMVEDFAALESQQFKPDADGHLFLITPTEMADLAKHSGLAIERLSLWGTPLITGHLGFSRMSGALTCWPCYHLERLAQKLPPAIKEKVCFALSVVLKPCL
jgi:2-polyprenyl-6-hydroxyphenyl methylase/3-demethylubiquinone-9 3-methyltransferase